MPIVLHFLLVYDHKQQRLIDRQEFSDGAAAAAAYADLEAKHKQASDLEIVLVGADSLDTIMKTHGHYFRSVADVENPFPSLSVLTH